VNINVFGIMQTPTIKVFLKNDKYFGASLTPQGDYDLGCNLFKTLHNNIYFIDLIFRSLLVRNNYSFSFQ